MALSPGTRLGSFEIIGPLGAGGMAEVYVAEDTKLSRKVALKILPPDMATSPDSRKRFEREAKAVAALNHPNIVTIYSVEEVEGTHFITMELVRGRRLTELIKKQAAFAKAPASQGVPLKAFFDIAIPLADAVGAAHQQGIIHRDLKPDNLMVNEEGRLKILDFGLAKLKQHLPGSVGSESPTVSATQAGTILGTVAYMSPEQAEGKTVDHRSDIFSIGIILYEMATGERPFGGDSTASILSSLLRDTPRSVTEVNPDLPRDLGKLIQRCLAKATEDRIQDAGDLRNELRELKREMDSGEALEAPTPRAVSMKRVLMVPLLVVATAVATYLLVRPTREAIDSELSPTGFEFTQLTTQAGAERFPSLSPDGEHVVYASAETGNWDIYLKRIGGERAINLTDDSPADDTMPAYSPDGDRIAFRSERDGGGIFIMGATGESVRRLTDIGYNPAWSSDGSEIAVATEGVVVEKSRQTKSQLWAVDVSTGIRRLITEGDAVLPSWSPHGDRIAYASLGDIWTISTEGGEPVKLTSKLTSDAGEPVWSPLGDTMYFASERGGSINIWRIPIDEATGEALGDPVPVTIGAGSRRHNISISQDGTRLAYIEENRHYNLHKYSFRPSEEVITGSPIPLTQGSRHLAFVDCSADGEWLTFHERSRGSQYDIAVIKTDGTGYRKLTDDPEGDRHPSWSPDGERIAFNSRRLEGRFNIWVIRFDGSGLEPLEESGGMYAVWSPDGSFLAYRGSGATTVLPVSETAEQPPPQVPKFVEEEAGFIASSWSSDGRKLAGYRRFDGRNAGIVVFSFDSQQFELLTEFGRNPVWLNDNRRLLFFHPDDDGLFLVANDTKQPKPLGRSGLFPALSPDNQSIYVSIATDEADIWLLTLESHPKQ